LNLSLKLLMSLAFLLDTWPLVAAENTNFAGRSAASPDVIAQIRAMMDVFAPIYIKCARADSVTAGDVPEGLMPTAEKMQVPTPLVPAPKGAVRYELWTIAGCEHSAQVIVALWYLDSGVETFIASPVQAPSWDAS
jgi:hypothetical protein